MSYDPGFEGNIGALPLNRPQAPSAGHKLQLSRYRPTQLEMMGDDVDLEDFFLTFNRSKVNIEGAVLNASVERTVQGASSLSVDVTDNDYRLLNSGLLSDQLTVEIDGLFWMLTQFNLDGPTVSLVFNEREVVLARRYDKPIKQSVGTSRAKVTRAEFALRLLREIKELPPIPYVIPALKVTQPIGTNAAQLAHAQQKTHNKGLGIPSNNNLKVKGAPMSPEQRRNSEIILDVGASMALPRKYLVAAIECCIQESSIINLRAGNPGDYNYLGGDPTGNPVGCFQQIKKWGWPASRDVAKDARAFYQHLGKVWNLHPDYPISEAILATQNSGGRASAYGQWQSEAERIIDAYGVVPGGQGSAADANNTFNVGQGDVLYEFYRGRPPTSSYQRKHGDPKWGKENSWDCWQRLASEVQWRCFFVSGTFYFISEDDLFKQKPIAVIDVDLNGIEKINGTYDSQGNTSDITINCRMGRWAAPPGSIVELRDLGPWDGRWLVNDVQRSLFNSLGTIVLKKPMPALPEPDSSNVSTASNKQPGRWAIGGKGTHQRGDPSFMVGTAIVQPIPRGYDTHLVQGVHQTAGLPGYPAADFGGTAGAPVLAVESGKITRLSGEDPAKGPWDPVLGVHGPFGWNIYLTGKSGTEYFYTHLGDRTVHEGQEVAVGDVIAHIGNYAKWGGVNHAHVGVHAGSSGHPNVYDLMHAKLATKR